MSSPRLKWLRIHKYRNVVPDTFIEFNDGFNVLLGRNGTGKTTLLELIEMLWTRGFGRIADEEFHLECAVEFDPRPGKAQSRDEDGSHATPIPGCLVRCTVQNAIPERSDAARGATRVAVEFSYRVALADLGGAEQLVIEGSPLGSRMTIVEGPFWDVPILDVHSHPVLWAAPEQWFARNPLIGTKDHPWKSASFSYWVSWCSLIAEYAPLSAVRFDESLTAFNALTDTQYQSNARGIEAVRWELDRRVDWKIIGPLDFNPRSFAPFALVSICQQQLSGDATREPPEFRLDPSELPLLGQFLEMTTYSGAWIDVRPFERKRDKAVERLLFRAPEFHFVLADDRGDIQAYALSYGEKRLLSFLWYLDCGGAIVIADELVNGFHHEWIERCVELMTGRQAFLASQNPLLLDSIPLTDAEDARKCFITCRRGPETEGQMQWANLSHEEAAEFYAAYARGTRYVHEILRGKGLW